MIEGHWNRVIIVGGGRGGGWTMYTDNSWVKCNWDDSLRWKNIIYPNLTQWNGALCLLVSLFYLIF